jgi:hypothetical protein
VSDDLHGTFLNAYAAGVVRGGGARPCMVELRTPVFKLFLDIDARYEACPDDALALAGETLRALALAAAEFFDTAPLAPLAPPADDAPADDAPADDAPAAPAPGAEGLVCLSSRSKREADGLWKRGFHVVWPDILVTSATALRFRAFVLPRLADVKSPFANDWDSAVDACVYRSNGLRMPWSAKGRGDDSFYAPVARVLPDGAVVPTSPPQGVAEVREHVRRLSIRAFAVDETPVLVPPDPEDPEIAAISPAAAVHSGDLAHYADVLPALGAALPLCFAGQRFTGLVRGDACFMLRSTSRWCLNLEAEHRSSNVYFVLSRRGVHQRCYCRKDTAEKRKYGMCKDFCSDAWPVPPEVVAAFFDDDDGAVSVVAAKAGGQAGGAGSQHRHLPSQVTKRALNLDSLLGRRVEAAPAKRRGGQKRA